MEDFPAAHSMDTLWFAVDRDGCVGVFDSDDGGAVPRAFSSPRNEDPAAAQPWLPGKTDLDAMVPVVSRKELYWRIKGEAPGERLLFPRDPESFAACKRILERDHRVLTVPLLDGHALLLNQRPSLLTRLLIAWRSRGVWRALPWQAAGWGRFWACGFVCYKGHGGTPDGGPYSRLPLLPHSVSVPHLPADVIERVSVVRLDFSFREKEVLQPCEHVPCLGWSDGWTDEQGTRHESGLEDAWRTHAGH